MTTTRAAPPTGNDASTAGRPHRAGPALAARSVGFGVIAAAAMAAFYVAVVWGASGSWGHLRDQAGADWGYLLFILAGFGTQVALLVELKARHRMDRAATTASGAGAGASTVGMVACCAHHIADLLPILGATGGATFLTDQRVPAMLAGITITAIGVAIAARRLRSVTRPDASQLGVDECVVH